MTISARNFRFCAILLAGALVVGYWAGDKFGPPNWETLPNVLGIVAQIAATMMGFLIAALAILASIAGTRLLRNLQRTGHYAILLSRLFISAACFFLLLVVSGAALFLTTGFPCVMEVLFGLILACCASLVDASVKLTAVLMALGPIEKKLE